MARRFHPTAIEYSWLNSFISSLDPVEVVVSKLARFHANDREDIREMVRRDMVSHQEMVECLQFALDAWSMDARSDDTPQILANFQRVERDYFGIESSSFLKMGRFSR